MRLILFFNGWGMDKEVVKRVEVPKGTEIEVINFPKKIEKEEGHAPFLL